MPKSTKRKASFRMKRLPEEICSEVDKYVETKKAISSPARINFQSALEHLVLRGLQVETESSVAA